MERRLGGKEGDNVESDLDAWIAAIYHPSPGPRFELFVVDLGPSTLILLPGNFSSHHSLGLSLLLPRHKKVGPCSPLPCYPSTPMRRIASLGDMVPFPMILGVVQKTSTF